MAQANSDYTDEVQPLYCQLAKPVLILWGREDRWIPLERGERLQVIPDAGHLVIEEQPHEVLRQINAFLL